MKQIIRDILLSERIKLSQKEVETFSKEIIRRLKNLQVFKRAKTVLLYYPIKNEVDTTPLFNTNKIFAFPLIHPDSNIMTIHQVTDLKTLKSGKFEIKEPPKTHKRIAIKDIDLVITPGLAFDKNGHRIGFGKGYFDKLFKNLSTNCTKIALAYDFQIIENVPAEPHDKKVDMIITETRTIKIK